MRTDALRPLLLGASCAALVAGALFAGGSAATMGSTLPAANPDKVLSHFLCRIGRFTPFDSAPTVGLEDQFGSWTATVLKPNLWCNPVRKQRGRKVTRIVDDRHHLKIYPLQPQAGTTKDLLVTNQFGADQPISINLVPISLMVPTRELPLARPRGLDHYLCYNVYAQRSVDKPVRLRDEFGTFRTRVLLQWLHCNPVEKTHGSRPPTTIANPEVHLACYTIRRHRPGRARQHGTINQFEPRRVHSTVRSRTAHTLCVPSLKQEVT